MTTTCGACQRQGLLRIENANARHAEGCERGCPLNIPVLLPKPVKVKLSQDDATIPPSISTKGRCGCCIEQIVRSIETTTATATATATHRKHDPTCKECSSIDKIDEQYGKHILKCSGCMNDMLLAYMTMRFHYGHASEHVIGCPNASKYISRELKERVGWFDYASCNLCRWKIFSGNLKRECWVPKYKPSDHCDTCNLPGHIQNMDGPRYWVP